MEMHELLTKQGEILDNVPPAEVSFKKDNIKTAAWGIIEETLEYLNTIGYKSWRNQPLSRNDQLEELTDILFYFLELVVLSPFTWDEITEQYLKKHEEVMERFAAVERGDFSWDKRFTEKGL